MGELVDLDTVRRYRARITELEQRNEELERLLEQARDLATRRLVTDGDGRLAD